MSPEFNDFESLDSAFEEASFSPEASGHISGNVSDNVSGKEIAEDRQETPDKGIPDIGIISQITVSSQGVDLSLVNFSNSLSTGDSGDLTTDEEREFNREAAKAASREALLEATISLYDYERFDRYWQLDIDNTQMQDGGFVRLTPAQLRFMMRYKKDTLLVYSVIDNEISEEATVNRFATTCASDIKPNFYRKLMIQAVENGESTLQIGFFLPQDKVKQAQDLHMRDRRFHQRLMGRAQRLAAIPEHLNTNRVTHIPYDYLLGKASGFVQGAVAAGVGGLVALLGLSNQEGAESSLLDRAESTPPAAISSDPHDQQPYHPPVMPISYTNSKD